MIYFKKLIVFLISIQIFINCSSIEKYNKSISENLSEKQQLEDINYLQKKIYKYQPAIDLFISKDALNKKFDSLKQLSKKPKKANELYLSLVTVVNSIKQGHNYIGPVVKKLSKKEIKLKLKQGKSPYSQFDYFFENDKLYLLNNYSKDTLIPNGTRGPWFESC